MKLTRKWWFSLTIFSTGMAIGLVFGILFFRISPGSCGDVDGFGKLGVWFAQHGNLDGSIRRGPVYPLFLGAIYACLGAGNHIAVIIAQSVVLALLGLSAQFVSRKLFGAVRVAFFTGLAVVLHPLVWWYVPRLWVELCYAFLVFWMVYAAIKATEKPKLTRILLFGISVGFSCLCKATTLLFPSFLCFGIGMGLLLKVRACAHIRWTDWVKLLLVANMMMVLTILPWTVRNRIVSGEWVAVSSNLGVEFFRGNVFAEQNSYLLRQSIPEIWAIAMGREHEILKNHGYQAGMIPNEAELDAVFNPLMKDYILHQPLDFVLKVLKQLPAFWIRGETRAKSGVFIISALLTLGLGVWGGWRYRDRPFTYVIWIAVIYFNFLYAATLAWARYSMPCYPLLLLLSIPVLVGTFSHKRLLKKG